MESDSTQNSPYIKSIHSSDFRLSRVRRWWLYVLDWFTDIVAVVISRLIILPDPRSQRFQVTDPRIQQAYHDDRTNINRVAVIISTAVPLVAIIVWCGYKDRPFRDYHHAILGLATALSFTALSVSIGKQMNSTLSSDFLSVCAPPPEKYWRAYNNGHPLSTHDCTTHGSNRLKQAMVAYPTVSSGLASSSMGYLSLYIGKELGLRLHPSVRRHLRATAGERDIDASRPGQALISLISILPYAGGMTFLAIITEYRGGGHGWGVYSGYLLGTVFALFGHFLYAADVEPS